jgi:DNA-binding NtrC family response regulator
LRHPNCLIAELFYVRALLVVEPNAAIANDLRHALVLVAGVDLCPEFSAARARLLAKTYDFLITNLRLRAYNGLHLVYLARSSGVATRSIVYTERREIAFAHEIQAAGAFYELRECLPYVIPAYLEAALPSADRRDAALRDRRHSFRGGRRSSDVSSLAAV